MEQVPNLELKGEPVIVGGDPELCRNGYYIGSLIEIPAKLGIISWTSTT